MRRKKWLKLYKTFFLFCEWESEICYFNELKWIFGYNIKKIDPIKTLSAVNKNKLEISKKSLYAKTWYSEKNFDETQSRIFILIDLDRYSKKEVAFIKASFEDKHISIITSNHDFELWILLHFDLFKKETKNYIDLINKISWMKYKKWDWVCSIKFFREIIQKYLEIAVKNWKELEKLNDCQWKKELKDKLPYTEIYKMIDEFQK